MTEEELSRACTAAQGKVDRLLVERHARVVANEYIGPAEQQVLDGALKTAECELDQAKAKLLRSREGIAEPSPPPPPPPPSNPRPFDHVRFAKAIADAVAQHVAEKIAEVEARRARDDAVTLDLLQRLGERIDALESKSPKSGALPLHNGHDASA